MMIAAFGVASGQAQQSSNSQASVKAHVVDANGVPVKSAFLELRPEGQNKAGVRAAASFAGSVVIPSLLPGKYDLSIEAGGFNTLSQTVEIDGDKDLGRIAMDADPNILRVSPARDVTWVPPEEATEVRPVPVSTMMLTFRGRIEPSSVVSGKRLTVQVSCSEQRPGMPERPQHKVSLRIAVSDAGVFEGLVPTCTGDTLAHRELRFLLKDENNVTIALLLPKTGPEGYYQSRIGIWLPLKPFVEQFAHVATFFPEFTDGRPLQGTLSVSPWSINPGPWSSDPFVVGENVFLNARLTNTSEEVLEIPSVGFESDIDWIISDDTGKRVPFHLFKDRTSESSGGRKALRSHLLFPGESETSMVNISLLFSLTSPGTYHVVARRIVRRLEVPGEEQITSAPSTFVIVANKQK